MKSMIGRLILVSTLVSSVVGATCIGINDANAIGCGVFAKCGAWRFYKSQRISSTTVKITYRRFCDCPWPAVGSYQYKYVYERV